MTEMANAIMGAKDAVASGGLIERVADRVVPERFYAPDLVDFKRRIVETATRGALKPSDVANFLRLSIISQKEDIREIRTAIRKRGKVREGVLTEDEKKHGYRETLRDRRRIIKSRRDQLRILNACRMPGAVLVKKTDREWAMDLINERLKSSYEDDSQKEAVLKELGHIFRVK